jgi:hypothetical protein
MESNDSLPHMTSSFHSNRFDGRSVLQFISPTIQLQYQTQRTSGVVQWISSRYFSLRHVINSMNIHGGGSNLPKYSDSIFTHLLLTVQEHD